MRLFALALISLSLAACATLRNDSKERAELHMAIGTQHFERGQYPHALKELLEAEKLDPSNPLVHNNLGLVYLVRERPQLAEKSFRRALSLKKDFTEARNNLVRALIDLKKFDLAEKEMKLVIDDLTYPAPDRAYMNLGYLYYSQGKWAQARDGFARAVQARRESCPANTFLGRTFFEMKNYGAAKDQFEKAIAFCQRQLDDEAHYYSALTFFRMGDRDGALRRFQELPKIYPEGRYRDRSRAMVDLIEKGVE